MKKRKLKKYISGATSVKNAFQQGADYSDLNNMRSQVDNRAALGNVAVTQGLNAIAPGMGDVSNLANSVISDKLYDEFGVAKDKTGDHINVALNPFKKIEGLMSNDPRVRENALSFGFAGKSQSDVNLDLKNKAEQENRIKIANKRFGGTDETTNQSSLQFKKGSRSLKRKDGSRSRRGLWDNIRANAGSGRKPTKEMLEQEEKIKAKTYEEGTSCVKKLKYKSGGKVWTKKEGQDPDGGLNAKGRAAYNKENDANLKPPQPKGGKRRNSFCARMKGMKNKLTSVKTANDPNSRINKSLRAWNC